VEVVYGPSGLARVERPSVTTIGQFDGVHRGHQAVFRRAVEAARADDLLAVAVTFDRHPQQVLHPATAPALITTLERKVELIGALGLDVLVVLRFDAELMSWPPERFAEGILADRLQARRVVVGENFTFGHLAAGTVQTLRELGPSLGFEAEGVPLVTLGGRRVSSSSIRQAVAEGDMAWPGQALGRPFGVDGRVVTGAGRGIGMGFPTANLEVPPRMLVPGRGVYAGSALAGVARFGAAIDVGTNPTFGDEPLHVEAFLLDFDGDLRGRDLTVEFVARLRDEERFESVEALIERMKDDVARTREILARIEQGRDGDDP